MSDVMDEDRYVSELTDRITLDDALVTCTVLTQGQIAGAAEGIDMAARIEPVHIDTPDDERGTAPQVPAEENHGVIDWRSVLRSQQGSTHDEDGNPLPQVPAEVLWEDTTKSRQHQPCGSVVDICVPVALPPGSTFRVVAADGAPQPEADR